MKYSSGRRGAKELVVVVAVVVVVVAAAMRSRGWIKQSSGFVVLICRTEVF